MTDAQPGEDLPEETAEVAGYLPEEGQEENYEEGQEGQQEVPMEDGADGTYAEGETHEMPEEGQQGDAAEANVEEAEMNAEAEDGNAWWTGNTADDGAEGAEGQEMQLDAADGEIHQDDPSAEVPDVPIDPDDPSAPVKIEAGWEAASWFQEDDSRRLRKLERLAGGDAEVDENGTLKLVPQSHLAPPGGGGTGHGWCDLCAKALCALRTGEEIELTPAVLEILETSSDGDGLGICIIEVPGTVEKKAIAGKDGAKLLDLCDASDVLAVFTKEAEAPAEESQTFESFKAGDVVEGKYGESWFEVEVLESSENGVKVKWAFDSSESDLTPAELRQKSAEPEVKQGDKVEAQYGSSWFDAEVVGLEDGKVKVKWGFDGSEADVEGNQVRLKPAEAEATETAEAAEPAELPELKEGVKIEAKYGDSFHDAEVVQQTEDGKVKIKWAHDGSEAEVGTDELRAKVEPPPPPPSKLLVLGQRRPRMVCEVKVLNRIDGKLPGHVTSLHKSSVDGTVGLTIIDFKPGSDLGKLIGKQGAIKLRLERISGSCLEYMGKDTDAKQAFLVGTAEERARAQALIELLQTAVDFRVKATEMPPVLRELTSVLVVPGPASSAVSAKLELQALQDSTDTMILALAKPAQLFATQTQKKEFSKDQVVECKFKGEWQEATILEISSWTADSDEEDETDGRTMKVKLKDGTETTALAFNLREHLDGAEALERERQLQKQEQRELLIVGADAEKRHEAQLRLAAMLEAKCPGAYSKDHNFEGDRIAVTSMSVGSASFEEDFLRRLGTASSCEIVLEEQVVYFASGSSFECARAESFLKPFLGDPSAAADAAKVDEIDGINFILVEKDKQKNLPQRVLNEVADKLGVVAFFDDGTTLAGVDDSVRLNVVCWDADKQTAALEMLKELQDVEPPPEETWNNDQKWDGEEQKEESQEWKQDDWKKDDWKKDDQKKDDWKKDDWKKDDWKKDEWKKDDWKKDDKKDDWKKDEWKKNDQKNDWGKKDDWKKDEWKKNDQKNNDWGKKDDWKKDEWKKEDDWKGQDKKRKWEDENSSWGNDKKAKNDWEDKGGWGKEKDKGGGGGWNQKNDWEKDKSGQKWGSSSNEKSWEDKSWKKDSGSDWKDDSKSWDQKGKKWGQESQDDAWKGKKDDWKNTKDEWNGKQAQQTWEKKDSWGQKKQEWGQNDNKTWEDQKGWGQENKSEKGWGSNSGNQAQGWQKENKRQQQWDAQDQQDTKRWRTEGSPSSAPRMSRPAPWQKNNTPAASPKQVLDTLPAYPDSIDDWQKVQNQVWRGAKPLPDGWIRVWSKRHDCEYYLRLQDNYATFEQNEVFYA